MRTCTDLEELVLSSLYDLDDYVGKGKRIKIVIMTGYNDDGSMFFDYVMEHIDDELHIECIDLSTIGEVFTDLNEKLQKELK